MAINLERTMGNLAANIQRLLDDHEWNQSELARRAGEKPMTISRILHKSHVPTLSVVVSIAAAFSVSVDSLLADIPQKKSRVSA